MSPEISIGIVNCPDHLKYLASSTPKAGDSYNTVLNCPWVRSYKGSGIVDINIVTNDKGATTAHCKNIENCLRFNK